MDGERDGRNWSPWEELTFEHDLIRKDYVLAQMLCLAKLFHIPVMMMRLEHRVNGMASVGDSPIIMLSNRMNVEEMRFVFGHEIGHIVLHSRLSCNRQMYQSDQRRHPREIEADNFSRNLIEIFEKREWVIPRPEHHSLGVNHPMENDQIGQQYLC